MTKEQEILSAWLDLTVNIRNEVETILNNNNGRVEFTDEMMNSAKWYTNYPVTAMYIDKQASDMIAVAYDGKVTAFVCFNTDYQMNLYRILNGTLKKD